MKHRLPDRLINNSFYFAWRFCCEFGLWVLVAPLCLGFFNTLLFLEGVGIGCAVTFELSRVRDRRQLKWQMLHHFGVPPNVESPALE